MKCRSCNSGKRGAGNLSVLLAGVGKRDDQLIQITVNFQHVGGGPAAGKADDRRPVHFVGEQANSSPGWRESLKWGKQARIYLEP